MFTSLTNLEFDEMRRHEEELLESEKEHDGTAEQEEQTPQLQKVSSRQDQPATVSVVLMEYLFESDKER
jgi:hypothetical protein